MTASAEIPGFHGYLATSDGFVLSKCTGLPLRMDLDKDGYPYVLAYGVRRRCRLPVHKAIASAFLGPCPDGMQVRHLDGKRDNPALANLAYGTAKQNADDRDRHGTTARGRRNGAYTQPHRRRVGHLNGMTKINFVIASKIRAAPGNQYDIADEYGVSQTLVSLIKRGKAWTRKPPILELNAARDAALKEIGL